MSAKLVRFASQALEVTIDPNRGGEVVSMLHQPSATELLWQVPWRRRRVDTNQPMDEPTWLSNYGGGWQVLFPNAGNACYFDGTAFGFHGPSSVQPWNWDGTTLTFESDGLELERRPHLDGARFVFEERIRNRSARPRAFVTVQHLAFGPGLLFPSVEIIAPVSHAERLVENEALFHGARDRAVDWSDWCHLSLKEPVARFGCLWVTDGRYRILNRDRGIGVRVRWSSSMWPYIWYWAEVRSTLEPPWHGRAEVLALEPASVPHSLGLEASSRRGEARIIQGGEELEAVIEVIALGS